MLDHFQVFPFVIGIVVGVLMLFFYNPPPTVVYEYPHPHNVNNRVYRDKNNVCYSYTSKEVDCDANEATLKTYPLQG